MVKKDESAFVDDQAKESLNFQSTLLLAGLILFAGSELTCGVGALVALPAWIALPVVNLVLCILAGVAVNDGKQYRCPFAWRLVQ